MKKLFALLLVLLMLTGCGVTHQENTTEAPPVAESTTATTETLQKDTGLRVHYVDVNQADGMILECDGEFAVIDAGYPESGPVMVEYLRDLGAQELELVVGTHPHGDHIGGLPDVLDAYPTDTVWTSQLPYSNDYVRDFEGAVRAQGIQLEMPRPGEVFQLGSATIHVVGPVKLQYEDANNLSLVLMVEHGDNRFLFTGDMEELAEHELLEAGVVLKADVLKVRHHGSYSSTGYRFLREVAPTYAVISCGAANDYGHPHEVTMSRLEDADTIIFRTDRMYTITAESDGTDIEFTWENRFAEPWRPE
jgi:competence protein ComEC